MNTYGISPRRFWKLFEHEGYQVLAHVSEDEDGNVNCVLEGCVPELNDVGTTQLKMGSGGKEDVARAMFDGLGEPAEVVTGFFEHVGPAVQSMLGGSLPEGYEVSGVSYDNGVKVDGQSHITRGPHMPISTFDHED